MHILKFLKLGVIHINLGFWDVIDLSIYGLIRESLLTISFTHLLRRIAPFPDASSSLVQ